MEQNLIPVERIERTILVIRGYKVILDTDLAALYGVETKVFNQAVKRNIERFPEDFMFQLTEEEIAILKCHFGTSNSHGGAPLFALCLHRTRCGDAVKRTSQHSRGACEHRNHARFCTPAPAASNRCASRSQIGGVGKKIRCSV